MPELIEMKPKSVILLLLVPAMAVAVVACRPAPGPIQQELPEATVDFDPTAKPTQLIPPEATAGLDPTQMELTEIAEFGPTSGPLIFAPDSLPAARVGVMYEAKISILGNVTPVDSFSLSAGTLPSGLELVPLEGEDAALIRGIPASVETLTFTVSVTCFGTQVSGQSGNKEYDLRVEN